MPGEEDIGERGGHRGSSGATSKGVRCLGGR